MPCGRLTKIETYEGIVDDIKADKIFGFLECDIRTPDHLKDYFSEMTPIFKNTLIDCNDENITGNHMFKYNQSRASRAKSARKLTGSYFGEKILIYTPLLKWYLEHGMEIIHMHSFIKASSHKTFAPFMDTVSDARREGDAKVKTIGAIIVEKLKNEYPTKRELIATTNELLINPENTDIHIIDSISESLKRVIELRAIAEL